MQNSKATLLTLEHRHPHVVEMLKEIFNMTIRDYDVLSLCGDGPLYMSQCNQSEREAARRLEKDLHLWFDPREQRWEASSRSAHA